MNAVQLNPRIRVEVKDNGPGEAVAILDYGPNDTVFWMVFLDSNGESVIVDNALIKKSQ